MTKHKDLVSRVKEESAKKSCSFRVMSVGTYWCTKDVGSSELFYCKYLDRSAMLRDDGFQKFGCSYFKYNKN